MDPPSPSRTRARARAGAAPGLVVRNARIATCAGAGASAHERLGIVDRGALVVAGGRVAWLGDDALCPPAERSARVIDARGRLVTPGLVDPHTHLVFAGSRADEFRKKMAGVDYRTLAAGGGGIMATVRATREATDAALEALALARLRAMLERGVTTVEVKSGYDLTVEGELRLLRLARHVSERPLALPEAPARRAGLPTPRTTTTLLGAHAVPPEHAAHRADYVRQVAEDMLPAAAAPRPARGGGDAGAAPLADACDVYLDADAFSREEARTILSAARRQPVPLRVRAHVGQFADVGGAELVAALGGLSCDHLEHVSDRGLAAMAAAGTRAVLLPGAWRTLRQAAPDAARMRALGVRVAVGTDLNPGTSPSVDLPLMAALAVRDAGLPADEALLAMTVEAAGACGVAGAGTLVQGGRADLVLWDHDEPAVFAYALGAVRASLVLVAGRVALDAGMRAPLFE